MHIQLTDILSCPGCGPEHGLILMVEEVSDRRVRSGWLGCASCRGRYRITDGVPDLRGGAEDAEETGVRADTGDAGAARGGAEAAEGERLAALMGVTQAPAFLLLAGPAAVHAAAIAQLLDDVQVIAVGADVRDVPEHPRVTRMRVARALPFRSGRVQGAVFSGAALALLAEAARVLFAPARLVLMGKLPDEAALARAGLRIAASAEGLAVAVRR